MVKERTTEFIIHYLTGQLSMAAFFLNMTVQSMGRARPVLIANSYA